MRVHLITNGPIPAYKCALCHKGEGTYAFTFKCESDDNLSVSIMAMWAKKLELCVHLEYRNRLRLLDVMASMLDALGPADPSESKIPECIKQELGEYEAYRASEKSADVTREELSPHLYAAHPVTEDYRSLVMGEIYDYYDEPLVAAVATTGPQPRRYLQVALDWSERGEGRPWTRYVLIEMNDADLATLKAGRPIISLYKEKLSRGGVASVTAYHGGTYTWVPLFHHRGLPPGELSELLTLNTQGDET